MTGEPDNHGREWVRKNITVPYDEAMRHRMHEVVLDYGKASHHGGTTTYHEVGLWCATCEEPLGKSAKWGRK